MLAGLRWKGHESIQAIAVIPILLLCIGAFSSGKVFDSYFFSILRHTNNVLYGVLHAATQNVRKQRKFAAGKMQTVGGRLGSARAGARAGASTDRSEEKTMELQRLKSGPFPQAPTHPPRINRAQDGPRLLIGFWARDKTQVETS
jgi:hypothetical protein